MSLSAAAIRLLASKGLGVDEIAEVAEANETESSLSAAAMRTRRWREKRHKASQNVTETKADIITETVTDRHETSPPRARVRDITPISENNNLTTPNLERAKLDDWPAGDARQHAKLIFAELESPWLDPMKSAGLVTTTGRLAAWRRDGASWVHDVLPIIAGRLMNRRKPVSTWTFFDEAVAESIAANRAALAIPEAGQIIPFQRATGPPRTIDEKSSAAWDYAIAKITQDEQSQN